MIKEDIRWFSLVLSLYVISTSACKKNQEDTSIASDAANGIAAVVTSNFSLSLFTYAMNSQNYNTVLSGKGPFTLIAPSNAAFVAGGYTSGVSIITSADVMSRMLPYCIINKRIVLDSLPLAFNQPIIASNGLTLYVTNWQNARDTAIIVNGARISTNDRHASNGLINVADALLPPPVFNDVNSAINGDPDLSFFNAALDASGLADQLRQQGPYTVFAPQNAAFIGLGIMTTDSIYKMDPLRLKALIKAHVVKSRNFIYNYILKADLTTNTYKDTALDNSNFVAQLIPDNTRPRRFTGIKLRSTTNNNIDIIQSNILTKNGLVHKIGALLKKDF